MRGTRLSTVTYRRSPRYFLSGRAALIRANIWLFENASFAFESRRKIYLNGACRKRWLFDFPVRVFLNYNCKMTGYCCMAYGLWSSVDEKHLMSLGSEPSFQCSVDEAIVTLVECASLTRRRYHFFPQVWWRRTSYDIREDNRRLVLHLRRGHHVTANSYHARQESCRAKIAITFLLYFTWYKHQSKIKVLGDWA